MIFFFQCGDVATFSLRGLLFGLTKLKLLKRISFDRDTTECLICYFMYLIHMSVCGGTHVCMRAFMCWHVWCAGCISNYQIFFSCVQLVLWGKHLTRIQLYICVIPGIGKERSMWQFHLSITVSLGQRYSHLSSVRECWTDECITSRVPWVIEWPDWILWPCEHSTSELPPFLGAFLPPMRVPYGCFSTMTACGNHLSSFLKVSLPHQLYQNI